MSCVNLSKDTVVDCYCVLSIYRNVESSRMCSLSN
jgi:hypothetical protein